MLTPKERDPAQAVLFLIDRCIKTLNALEAINNLHSETGQLAPTKKDKILQHEVIFTLVSITRDSFCMYIANLFDIRRDVHSLKKHFTGPDIFLLEKHHITQQAISARHANIGHFSKSITKWPDIKDILAATDLKELLLKIETAILTQI